MKDSRTILTGENRYSQLTYGWGNGSIYGRLNCQEIYYSLSRSITNKKAIEISKHEFLIFGMIILIGFILKGNITHQQFDSEKLKFGPIRHKK